MLAVESRVRGAGSHSPPEAMEENSPACSPTEESPPRGNPRSSRLPSPESISTRSNEFRRSPSPGAGRSHINTSNSNITTTSPSTSNNSSNNVAGMYSIVVAVRKRPKIVGREDNENDIVRCETKTTLAVYEPRTKLDLTPIVEPSVFSFDTVYDENCSNAQIYHDCCQPLLQNVRDGGGAVVFAFGQTGSGKTYTMLGQNDTPGLYGQAVKALLDMTTRETLTASFFEVYGTKLYDLLNDRAPVKMLQDEYKNIHIVGLTERKVSSISDVDALMTSGQLLRATGTTHANDRSSRSHAVLEIKVKLSESPSTISASMEPNINSSTEGRITFVDLAGSERASDTSEATSQTRREGAEINKSLLALKECIRAMSMRKKHIPFRGSKLTQILRESFMGNCKTCVIATISPCQSHCEDTINTLRYAYRIKELKGKANGLQLEAPIPCQNCGLPIFMGDRHVCRRFVVQCPHCRMEMDKGEIEAHLIECKEFPLRCPHCNERMLRGELDRHTRRCTRLPVKCNTCGQFIARNAMERHVEVECIGVKRKCRFCYQLITRGQMNTHEAQCEMRKVACPFCLQFVRSHKLEAHQNTCVRNPNVHRSITNNSSSNNEGNNNNTHSTSLATTPTGHSVSVSRSASRTSRADWVNNAANLHIPLDIPNSTRKLSSLSNPETGIEAANSTLLPHMTNVAERPLPLMPEKRLGGVASTNTSSSSAVVSKVASKSATPEQAETDANHKNSNNNANKKNKSMINNEGKDAVASSSSLILLPTHLSHTTHSNLSNSHESGSTSPLEAKATLKYNATESTSRTNRLHEARLEVAADEQANKSSNANVRVSSQQKYKYNAPRPSTNRFAKNDARNANSSNNTNGNSVINNENNHQGANRGNNNALQNKIGLMHGKNYPEQLINSNRSPALTSNIMNGFHLDNNDQNNNNNNNSNKNNANMKDKKQNNFHHINNSSNNNNNNNNNNSSSNGTMMTCPYSRYGCVVKVTPLNLQAHLQQALEEHLELVTMYADRLDAQNVELRRAIVLREPGDSATTTPAKEEHQRQLVQRSNDAQKVSAITSQETHR